MLGYAVFGGLLAGFYGILHDEVTYSISPEYFTRLKFAQFHYADFGLPPRVFVGEIGFLATWWVGFFAAWFMGRITVPGFSRKAAFRHNVRGFQIVFVCALAASMAGYALGVLHGTDYTGWKNLAARLRIVDLRGFVRVAYIHNASYLGGLAGLVVAIFYLLRRKSSSSSNASA